MQPGDAFSCSWVSAAIPLLTAVQLSGSDHSYFKDSTRQCTWHGCEALRNTYPFLLCLKNTETATKAFRENTSHQSVLRPLSLLPDLFLLKSVYMVTSSFEPTISPILFSVTGLAECNCNILYFFMLHTTIYRCWLFYFCLFFLLGFLCILILVSESCF